MKQVLKAMNQSGPKDRIRTHLFSPDTWFCIERPPEEAWHIWGGSPWQSGGHT